MSLKNVMEKIADLRGCEQPKLIANGDQGAVYSLDETTVVKVTFQVNEAQLAHYLSSQKTPDNFPQFMQVFSFTLSGGKAWAVVRSNMEDFFPDNSHALSKELSFFEQEGFARTKHLSQRDFIALSSVMEASEWLESQGIFVGDLHASNIGITHKDKVGIRDYGQVRFHRDFQLLYGRGNKSRSSLDQPDYFNLEENFINLSL